MKASVWYDMDEKIPPRTGYYIAFKGMSMGDDETGCEQYYWDAGQASWRDSLRSSAHYVNVIYWCDAEPWEWYNKYDLRRRDEVSVAEQDAWAEVQRAISRYEMIKSLTKV